MEDIPNNLTHIQWLREDTTVYKVQFFAIPILVILGTIGNVFSILTLSSSPLRKFSSSVYLISLAVSDTVFLLCLLSVWVSEIGINLHSTYGWCQLLMYFTYVASFMSVWLIVAFTLERFIAICYPLLKISICTTKRARYVVFSLLCLPLLLYFYILLVTDTENGVCEAKEGYSNILETLNNIDIILTLILPVALIVSLNIKIVHSLCSIKTNLMMGEQALSLRACSFQCAHPRTSRLSNRFHIVPHGNITQHHVTPRSNSQHHVTRTLVVVSSTFIVLNLPSYAVRFLSFLMVSS